MTERSDPRLRARLAMGRLATSAVMVVERGWPLVLPLVMLAGLFLSLAWLGLFAYLPDTARLGLAVFFALAALGCLYPLRFFRLPRQQDIDRRIEAANALLHAPIRTQTDRPSGRETGFSQALWREHQRRMAARLDRLGSDLPRTRVPERDPWGLRAAVALLFVVALAFSYGPLGGRVADAFRARAALDLVPPRIDAWVTPPAYTGKPPILLTAGANQSVDAFTVPAGSAIALRVAGGGGNETLTFTGKDGTAHQIEPEGTKAATAKTGADTPPSAARQFSGKLDEDGTLALTAGETDLGQWAFTVIPDRPPTISFAGDPKRAVNGTLELNYRIDDDYGAASARAGFALAEPVAPDARPLYAAPDMPLVLPRRGDKDNSARTARDLTEHVWAGATVKLTLEATDAAGQTARSETKTLVMPERPFTNPLARAVTEQRRLLALDANVRPRVLDLMDAITLRPEDTLDNMAHYLVLMSARTRLKMARNDDQLRDVVSYLWDIALGIEEGDLSAAEKRLRQAQQNLQDLLDKGASDEEIDKAMQELRQAMENFLREFAERNRQNPNAMQLPSDGQELRQSDLNRLMDQIENLAKSGDRDKARELLSQLENMMNNLQAGRQQGQPGQDNSELRQQMDRLGEIMRRQQEMMNETFRMDRTQRGQQGQQGEDEQFGQQERQDRPGQQGRPMTPQEFANALKQLQEGQGKLQGDLDQLQKGLEGLGLEPSEGFGEAGRAMGDAGQALGEGESGRAVGQQGRAMEALRKGVQDMMQQLQAMQGDDGASGRGARGQDTGRDPLGRPRATSGPDFGDSVKVPDEIDVQRARQILEAIRKRLGNALSPDIERSYLERLLELK